VTNNLNKPKDTGAVLFLIRVPLENLIRKMLKLQKKTIPPARLLQLETNR
jgi:hypothetical protein